MGLSSAQLPFPNISIDCPKGLDFLVFYESTDFVNNSHRRKWIQETKK